MSGMNQATVVGNLGKDPEVRYTASGQAVATFSLATTEKFKNKGGEQQERTEWHNIVVWGKRAEALGKFLKKGQSIWVEGRVQTRSWEDKDGSKRYATDINATDLGLIGSGGGRKEPQPSEPDSYESGESDDNIPF